MPRHRAPSVPARLLTPALTAAAATGAALSASLLSPTTLSPTTVGATGPHDDADRQVADQQPADQDGTDWSPPRSSQRPPKRHSSNRPGADRLPERRHRTPLIRLLRPMTSGEQQYRNGCHQGYVSDNCEQFSVTGLLRHGINPYRTNTYR